MNAKDLIQKRNIIEDKKNKQLEVEVPDVGTFLFRLPTLEDVEDADAYEKSQKRPSLSNNYLVYSCCLSPDLKDKDLQEAYKCKDPVDIVSKVLMFGEVLSISDLLMKKAGIDKDSQMAVKELKN